MIGSTGMDTLQRKMDADSRNRVSCKTCSTCKQSKSIPEFNMDLRSRDGRQHNCRECSHRLSREWYLANADEVNKKSRLWHKGNPEKVKAKTYKWMKNNTERVRVYKKRHYAKYAEKYRNCVKMRRKENPILTRTNNQRRRAVKANAKGSEYTKSHHILARWALYGGLCWMCGCRAEQTDHVIPLNAGGSHWPSNLRPICAKCNLTRPKDGSDLPTRVGVGNGN